jgi:hypothetical protein
LTTSGSEEIYANGKLISSNLADKESTPFTSTGVWHLIMQGWIERRNYDYAESNSLVHDKWKPAGRAGDGWSRGAPCLLPGMLGVPMP